MVWSGVEDGERVGAETEEATEKAVAKSASLWAFPLIPRVMGSQ